MISAHRINLTDLKISGNQNSDRTCKFSDKMSEQEKNVILLSSSSDSDDNEAVTDIASDDDEPVEVPREEIGTPADTDDGTYHSTEVPIQTDQPDISLIKTFEKTSCSFCSIELNPGDGIVIRSCLHNYCLDCIRGAIEQTDAAEIACPLSCGGMLLDREIKEIVSPEAYQNFLDRSLKAAEEELEEIFRCRGSGCSAVFMLSVEEKEFTCPQCGNLNCLKCKALKNGNLCTCAKDNISNEGQNPAKRPKIDPELKQDFDSSWDQLFESFEQSTSTSEGGSSVHDVLSRLEQTDVLKSTREFTCTICLTEIPPGDGIILKECYHMFCRECLASTIEHCEEPKVKCPFQKNDYACPEFITDREIKALVSPELHEKFVRRSVNQAEMSIGDSFHCKSVNCAGWCVLEEGVPYFTCPVCNMSNCLRCKAIHDGMSCEDYQTKAQEDEMDTNTKKMITDLMSKGKAKKCPRCKIIIQKNGGCDHMYCTVCKCRFNWSAPKAAPLRAFMTRAIRRRRNR